MSKNPQRRSRTRGGAEYRAVDAWLQSPAASLRSARARPTPSHQNLKTDLDEPSCAQIFSDECRPLRWPVSDPANDPPDTDGHAPLVTAEVIGHLQHHYQRRLVTSLSTVLCRAIDFQSGLGSSVSCPNTGRSANRSCSTHSSMRSTSASLLATPRLDGAAAFDHVDANMRLQKGLAGLCCHLGLGSTKSTTLEFITTRRDHIRFCTS